MGPALRRWFPLAVVGCAYAWASVTIISARTEESPRGSVTIRIGHWQLETSVREAFNAMAAEYAKRHPEVRIVQDPIPETTYGQWVTTNLMGGTAPDLMEIGLGLDQYLWTSYKRRYFLPLTQIVGRPNPYNRGTSLARVPLRQTFKDGMRSSYDAQLQDYMTINLSMFGERIFYNRGLFKKLTGLDRAPDDYRGFMAACKEIGRQRGPGGSFYVPIASSKYHLWMWEYMLCDLLTYPALRRIDFDRDGQVSIEEQWVGFKTGRIGFDFPPYRARFKMFREVSDQFEQGYTGLSRDDAVLLFSQQRAVFLATGTWDARSLQKQAEGSFEVGVLDFPRPKPTDPEYGKFIEGPLFEQPWIGFPFGVTRTSKHPEVAIDFLLFLSSRANNEKFNQIIGWIPGIEGTKMDPLLKAFEPHLEGVYGTMNFALGGETAIRWAQDYALLQVNQIGYDEFAKRFAPFYLEHGLKDWQEAQRDWRRGIRDDEQFLAGVRAKALMAADDEGRSAWVKYRALTSERLVLPEVTHARLVKLVMEGVDPKAPGPYEHADGRRRVP